MLLVPWPGPSIASTFIPRCTKGLRVGRGKVSFV